MQLVKQQPEGGERSRHVSDATDGEEAKRASLRSLGALKPYLLRHKEMLAVALIALLVSAGATLAVPLAVRRMIDVGFSGIEPDLVNKYFATLAGIGLILALSMRSRIRAR